MVYVFLLKQFGVWGGDLRASSGHLLFVVIADFGMLSLERLPTWTVHSVPRQLRVWEKGAFLRRQLPRNQSLALYMSTRAKMINHFEENLYKLQLFEYFLAFLRRVCPEQIGIVSS